MTIKYKISIITINYNNAGGLEATLASVFGQDNKCFEFIVIDGNSTDKSKALLREHDGQIDYWRSESDGGIYEAMNKGIRVATGEFLLFLNSGDALYNSEVIGKIHTEICGKYSIYYGDIVYNEIYQNKPLIFPDVLTFGFFYEYSISHQAAFIKRTLFSEIFFYNEHFKIVSDWEFFTYAICKCNVPYRHIKMFVTTYDATGISSNQENHDLVKSERTLSLNKHFPSFVADYSHLPELRQKQSIQFFYIKQYPVAWKIMKALMKIILIFIPGQPKRSERML